MLPVRRRAVVLFLLIGALLASCVAAPTAQALPQVAGQRILTLGDSLRWQICTDRMMRFGDDAPQYLRDRDGGCFGWSGATAAEMAFMVQGGRFYSNGAGQPDPKFDDRGQTDVWSIREAINRADIIVIGLGTNDSGRMSSCAKGAASPWPVAIPADPAQGVTPPPCSVSIDAFRAELDYFTWLAGGKPLFWFDVAVTNPADPAYPHATEINDAIWGAAARHPNFHPIPWARNVAAHPEWLRADGVHLNSPAGNAGMYQLLMDAIYGCGYR